MLARCISYKYLLYTYMIYYVYTYIMCAAIPPPKRKRFIGKPREEKTPINAQTYTRDASARLASAVAGGDEESDHVFR